MSFIVDNLSSYSNLSTNNIIIIRNGHSITISGLVNTKITFSNSLLT